MNTATVNTYKIDDFYVPFDHSNWCISANSSRGEVMLKFININKKEAEKIAEFLGYGKLATPNEISNGIAVKNDYAYWEGLQSTQGHFVLMLYKY